MPVFLARTEVRLIVIVRQIGVHSITRCCRSRCWSVHLLAIHPVSRRLVSHVVCPSRAASLCYSVHQNARLCTVSTCRPTVQRGVSLWHSVRRSVSALFRSVISLSALAALIRAPLLRLATSFIKSSSGSLSPLAAPFPSSVQISSVCSRRTVSSCPCIHQLAVQLHPCSKFTFSSRHRACPCPAVSASQSFHLPRCAVSGLPSAIGFFTILCRLLCSGGAVSSARPSAEQLLPRYAVSTASPLLRVPRLPLSSRPDSVCKPCRTRSGVSLPSRISRVCSCRTDIGGCVLKASSRTSPLAVSSHALRAS